MPRKRKYYFANFRSFFIFLYWTLKNVSLKRLFLTKPWIKVQLDLHQCEKKRYFYYNQKPSGIGDKIAMWLVARAISKKFKLQFIHSRFLPGYHPPKTDWEIFLGFGSNELQYEDIVRDVNVKIVRLPKFFINKNNQHLVNSLYSLIIYSFFPEDNIVFVLVPSLSLLLNERSLF
ncbi:hypothetical protein KAH94_05220, partial [bacterium]|nr:hypothetical protein [bacterium]